MQPGHRRYQVRSLEQTASATAISDPTVGTRLPHSMVYDMYAHSGKLGLNNVDEQIIMDSSLPFVDPALTRALGVLFLGAIYRVQQKADEQARHINLGMKLWITGQLNRPPIYEHLQYGLDKKTVGIIASGILGQLGQWHREKVGFISYSSEYLHDEEENKSLSLMLEFQDFQWSIKTLYLPQSNLVFGQFKACKDKDNSFRTELTETPNSYLAEVSQERDILLDIQLNYISS